MRKRIEFVDELRDPARHPYTALTDHFASDADAVAHLTGEYPDALPVSPPPRDNTIYFLYGALLGLAEVAIILYAIFGGHS